MDILDDLYTDEFTLTQPIVGVTERSVTERSVIQTVKVIKQVNVIK